MRMESDEFDFLAPAYVRGFLRTYARFLHIDSEPLMEEFERRYSHAIDASQIVALERRARRVPKEPRRLNRLGISIVAVLALVTLLALVGLFSDPESDSAAERTPPPTVPPRASATAPIIVIPSPTPSDDTSDSILTEADLADGIELEIVAIEECWVDVNVDGADFFADTLAAGEKMTFTADDAMEVVLGRPDAVRLVLNEHSLKRLPESDAIKFELPADLERIQ